MEALISKGKFMTLEKAILLAMIEASFKDKIIDEATYKRMKQSLNL